jgi:hypothetical protein
LERRRVNCCALTQGQRHPELRSAELWASENKLLLTRAFERFREDGEWPTLEVLQLDFARSEQDIDVRALAFQIPNSLGFVELERLVLRLRCLRYLPAAAPLLSVWFSSLKTANERWLSETEESYLTRDDVLRAAHGDASLAMRVSKLLLRERWAFGGGTGVADEPWSREVNSGVRIVHKADSPEELLEARDEEEYPPPLGNEPAVEFAAAESGIESRRRRFANWAKEHYLGAVAAGLTVLAVVAFFKWGYTGLVGNDSSGETGPTAGTAGTTASPNKTPPGPGIVEEAGEGGARTYRNPRTLSQTGPSLEPFQRVKVDCRVYAPTLPSVKPDGNWYRILSDPWEGRYYAPANSFWNGDVPGKLPYTHNTDFDVPPCGT